MKGINKQRTGFKFGQHRLVVLEKFGEICIDGRIHRYLKVKTEKGDIYNSIRLYNAQGKFIKQYLFEPEAKGDLGFLILGFPNAKDEAAKKALEALSGYKFMMFGYWAAIWVHLNQMNGKHTKNPFRELVKKARELQIK